MANSTTGHDLRVKLKKTLRPYNTYGLDSVIDLSTTLQEYSIEFTTINSGVTDGCLQFYLYPFAEKTDIYYIDNVRLEKVVNNTPEVIGKSPTGMNIPVTARINLNFITAMDNASVEAAFSTLPATNGSFAWNGNNMTYTPDSNLAYNQTYNVTVGTGAKDLAGNMLSPYSWQFTTALPSLNNLNLISNPGFESGKLTGRSTRMEQ